MRELTKKELKEKMLELLNEVDAFCKKNNIRYYLTYGTLLGAVRHQGFIPWDDDIDVMMPRDDYDRFLEEFMPSNSNIMISSPKNKGHHYCWAKLYDDSTVKEELSVSYKKCKKIGLDIDIYPIDKISCSLSKKEKKAFFHKRKNLYYLMYFANSKFFYNAFSIKRAIACLTYGLKGKFLTNEKILNIFHKHVTQYNSLLKNYNLTLSDEVIAEYPKKDLLESVEVLFEGNKYSCPKEYHDVLTIMYGDYMKLPPENERVSHHAYRVYWKDANL